MLFLAGKSRRLEATGGRSGQGPCQRIQALSIRAEEAVPGYAEVAEEGEKILDSIPNIGSIQFAECREIHQEHGGDVNDGRDPATE